MDDENVALFTDQYELTMAQAYWAEGLNKRAVFSLFVRRLPASRNYLLACGLDTVLCVRGSEEDAATVGFETYFLWNLTRPMDPSGDEELRSALLDAGILRGGVVRVAPHIYPLPPVPSGCRSTWPARALPTASTSSRI